jgi:cellobiose epimerase
MNRKRLWFAPALMFLIMTTIPMLNNCSGPSRGHADEKDVLAELYNGVMKDLTENLLPFWIENSVDTNDPNMGFFGAIENDGTGVTTARKHNVLFTRYLWTYSAAYRVLGDEMSLGLAHRAYEYLSSYFHDQDNGGVFWELNADGTVSDSSKVTYGLSFAIYSLSEYYRATRNEESLQKAISIFSLIEEHAYDREHGGYLEAFTADWRHVEGAGIANGRAKSMNTHLHILEAYTNLYRVWPDRELKEKLIELIDVFMHHVINHETSHLELFFDRDWSVHGRYDSYGHDIEFSWLFHEAAEVLEDDVLKEKITELSLKIADVQLKEGLNSQGAMIYEKEGDVLKKNISWWVQAEAIVGFLNAWELSGDRKFLDAALGVWEYIENNMIDRQDGGWFPDLDEHGDPMAGKLKGNSWTCPYHNVRMGLEINERFSNGSLPRANH